jgi:hypothetical protein
MDEKNLWGNIKDIPTFRPPSSFLVEQAKIIEVQTKMAIKAEVLQYTRYGIVKVTFYPLAVIFQV